MSKVDYMEVDNFLDFLPKYEGEVEIVDGLIIALKKMPIKKHQENMNKTFGWKFRKRDNEKEAKKWKQKVDMK